MKIANRCCQTVPFNTVYNAVFLSHHIERWRRCCGVVNQYSGLVQSHTRRAGRTMQPNKVPIRCFWRHTYKHLHTCSPYHIHIHYMGQMGAVVERKNYFDSFVTLNTEVDKMFCPWDQLNIETFYCEFRKVYYEVVCVWNNSV